MDSVELEFRANVLSFAIEGPLLLRFLVPLRLLLRVRQLISVLDERHLVELLTQPLFTRSQHSTEGVSIFSLLWVGLEDI